MNKDRKTHRKKLYGKESTCLPGSVASVTRYCALLVSCTKKCRLSPMAWDMTSQEAPFNRSHTSGEERESGALGKSPFKRASAILRSRNRDRPKGEDVCSVCTAVDCCRASGGGWEEHLGCEEGAAGFGGRSSGAGGELRARDSGSFTSGSTSFWLQRNGMVRVKGPSWRRRWDACADPLKSCASRSCW